MDSTSRRVPGSEEDLGQNGDKKAERPQAKVIRASKPLPRPKKSEPEEAPKPERKPSSPLRPGDRLWSKPKKRSDSRRDSRLVYLSTQEYEAGLPPAAEAPVLKPKHDERPLREAQVRRKPHGERPAAKAPRREERATAGTKERPRQDNSFARKQGHGASARKPGPGPKVAGYKARQARQPAGPYEKAKGVFKPGLSRAATPAKAPGRAGLNSAFKPKPAPREVGAAKNLRALAAKVLQVVLEKRQPLKTLLQTEQEKLAFEADRALLREMAAGVLRRLPHIDWCIDEAAKRGLENIQPEIISLLRVGVYQILFLERVPAYAAVDQCVEAAKAAGPQAAGFVNGILRSVAENKVSLLEAPYSFSGGDGTAMRFGMAPWMASRYERRFKAGEAEALMQALQEPPATTIVFVSASAAEEGERMLSKEGFSLSPDPHFDLVRAAEGGNPSSSEAFRRGLFYICDPASLVPALLLPVKREGNVLDLCAAPGTKTVILSARAKGGGRVFACDVNVRRLRQIRQNTARLGLANVTLVQLNAEQPLPFSSSFPSVLLDAPCSSLGTIRRNPEIRWQIRPEEFGALQKRQIKFLERAAEAVAPSGHLLYSVCSIEEEETTQVAELFLRAHPDFKAEALSAPDFLAPLLENAGDGRAFCMPHRRRWDGFFAALFRRDAL